jgi:antitoxin component YwqK of YwqJK toxin-antitoxin module
MKRLTTFFALLHFCLNINAQTPPPLWPEGNRIVKSDKDTLSVLDEDGNKRMKIWFEPGNRDSIIIGYGKSGKVNFRFEGKRRSPLTGCTQFFHEGGNQKEKSCWENDLPEGIFLSQFANGKPQESGRFDKGEKAGIWKTWHPNGSPKSSGLYNEGAKDEIWVYFNPDSSESFRETWSEGLLLMSSDFRDESGKIHSGGNAKAGYGTIMRYFGNGTRKQSLFVSNGQADGLFTDYDSLGKILRTRYFKKGLQNGVMTEFYPDSIPASKTSFANNLEEGPYFAYSKEGKPLVEGWYKNGKEDSTWLEKDESGITRSRYSFSKGELDGNFTEYHKNGLKAKIVWFKNGLQDSLSESWDEKGNKSSRLVFRNGQKNGPALEWHPNSRIRSEGRYENDLEIGTWTYMYDNAVIQSRGNYVEGRPEGEWTTWFGNGKISSRGSYFDGNENGEWSFYYPTGSVKSIEIWKDGRLMEINKCLAPSGRKLNCGKIEKGKGRIITYNLDGVKEGEGELLDGLMSGNWQFFHPDGKKQAEGQLENGKRNGLWKFYGPDGSLNEETLFKKGQATGKTRIFQNGKLTEEFENNGSE